MAVGDIIAWLDVSLQMLFIYSSLNVGRASELPLGSFKLNVPSDIICYCMTMLEFKDTKDQKEERNVTGIFGSSLLNYLAQCYCTLGMTA